MDSLDQMFENCLRDLLSAEQQAVKAMPKMAKAATSTELRDLIKAHLEQTKTQVERLKQIFEMIGKRARAKECRGMAGILEEMQETMGESQGGALGDLAIGQSALHVEHYEIASYEVAKMLAKSLGHADAVELLDATLKEEVQTAKSIVQGSKPLLKQAAAEAEPEEEDEEYEDEDEAGEEEEEGALEEA